MGIKNTPSVNFDFEAHAKAEKKRKLASAVDGVHYSARAKEAKRLLREKSYEQAAGLLLRLTAAVEAEAKADPTWPIAPFYHSSLAVAYRRLGRPELADKAEARYAKLLAGRAAAP
jgi:hypothetical protein